MSAPNAALMGRVRDRVTEIITDPKPVLGQWADPCVCGAPRWEHAGGNRSGRHAPTVGTPNGCKRWAENKIEALAWRAVEADGRKMLPDFKRHDRAQNPGQPVTPGQLRVRPSDGDTCKRQVWYRNFPPEDYRPLPTDERAATIGTALHKSLLDAWAALYPWRLIEHEVTIPGLDRNGRLDSFDPLTGVLDDVKTAGTWKWDLIGDEGPTEGTWNQAAIYALALSRAGHTVRTIRLRYIHREKGYEEKFERTYTDMMGRTALRDLTALASVLDAYRQAVDDGDTELAEDLIPEREGRSHNAFPCSFCPARGHCWSIDRATALGRSPESFTILGPAPADDAVAATLAEYDAARKAETAGKNAKAFAKSLLDGIDHGTYGEWVYAVTTQNPKDSGAYIRLLQENYDMPAEFRPALSDLPQPTRREERIAVKRVRAAKREATKAKAAEVADAEPTSGPDTAGEAGAA